MCYSVHTTTQRKANTMHNAQQYAVAVAQAQALAQVAQQVNVQLQQAVEAALQHVQYSSHLQFAALHAQHASTSSDHALNSISTLLAKLQA